MEKRSFFHLLLVLMAFSQLFISTTAISFTRTGKLLQQRKSLGGLGNYFHKIAQMSNHKSEEKDEFINRRMDIELNDYPGSGANNRHTPPQPPGKD